tara:strand:- start:6433 stop:6621 length:189 start_codon:yes stop_codon:yes gene_type:complete
MRDLGPNLPALAMTKLIGTPEADYVLLRRWANAFMVTAARLAMNEADGSIVMSPSPEGRADM